MNNEQNVFVFVSFHGEPYLKARPHYEPPGQTHPATKPCTHIPNECQMNIRQQI